MSSSITFMDTTKSSSIITAVSEELGENEESCILKIRVLNESKWKKMIKLILLSAAEDEEFGCTVRQEFYLNESSSPSFVWTIILWGDLIAAKNYLLPILSKRGAPPPPPKSLNISVPVTKEYVPSVVKTREGTMVKEVLLPSRHPGENVKNTDEVVKVGDTSKKRTRAYATGYVGGR